MIEFCGYLVVRKPSDNFDPQGRGGFSDKAPKLNDVYYAGIDRMPWFDLDEEYYANTLSTDIAAIRNKIRKTDTDFTGIKVCADFKDAEHILNYVNRSVSEFRNEIISISSKSLNRSKGIVESNKTIIWYGYDIVALGNSSILIEGLFTRPDIFENYIKKLNCHGLFDDLSVFDEYVAFYKAQAALGTVIELIEDPYPVEAVWVGKADFE